MIKHFKIKKTILFTVFFFTLIGSVCQTPTKNIKLSIKNLGKTEGLTESHINSTFFDGKKNSWFLTNNKLILYRGNQLKSLEFNSNFSNKGFNNVIEDANGNFWISENYEWFYPFNIQRCVIFNTQTKVTLDLEKYINKKINPHSICSGSKGDVIISTKNGELYKFEPLNKKLTKLLTLGPNKIKILLSDKKSLIVCIEKNAKFDDEILELSETGKILHRIKLKDKLVTAVLRQNSKSYFEYQSIQNFGIQEIGGDFEKSFRDSKDNYLTSITYNNNNKIWVVNFGNSLQFLNQNFDLIKSENFDFLIHNVNHDGHGNIFLATNNGVKIVRLIEQKIKTYLLNPAPEKINDNYSCRGIIKGSDEKVVVNTNRKRQIIDLKTGKIISLGKSSDSGSPDNKFMLAVTKNKAGEFLFGEDMLVKTDLKTAKNTLLCKLDSTKIWSIANYREGLLLGLEKKGIIYYNEKEKSIHKYQIKDLSLKSSIIYDFYVVNRDSVLIASEAGLFVLIKNSELHKIDLGNTKNAQISIFSIKSLNKNSKILLLASSSGIWKYHLDKKKLSPFVIDVNYQKKKFLSAYQSVNGIWASSEEGVWHFDKHGLLLKIYTESDGLSSKECNRLAHFQDENGILYFGGVNGLNVINPKDFSSQKESIYPLKIAGITSFKNQVKNREFSIENNSINLYRDENSLAIKLEYEDYKFDCEKKYFYKSNKSIAQEWTQFNGNTLLLENIGRGPTEIMIKVVSCDNFTESSIKKIVVNRPKQLYLEWYFVPSVLLIIALLFWVLNKYTTLQLQKRNEILQQKIDLQTRSLQESLNLKETLLSILIHDVRYPVQSFYGLSKKLHYLLEKNDFERLVLLGKETEEKSRRVLWLIDELVYWVKNANNKYKVEIEEKNIGNKISQILEIYSNEMSEKKLKVEAGDLNKIIRTDFGLLIIVLRNLIYNAIMHAKPDTIINLTLESINYGIKLEIKNEHSDSQSINNNGLGIGLALLLPMLEKSNIKLKTVSNENVFTASLEINNTI